MRPQTRAVQHVWWLSPSGDIPMCQRCLAAQQTGPGVHTEYLWVGFGLMFWGLQQDKGKQKTPTAPLRHLPSQHCCLGQALLDRGLAEPLGSRARGGLSHHVTWAASVVLTW